MAHASRTDGINEKEKAIYLMAKSRTEKATLNIAAAAFYEVVALVCGLILPRLIIGNFGSAYNGIVASAKEFLSLITILNLGITAATRAALYKPLAEHDTPGINGIVNATARHMRRVGIVLLGYLAVLAVAYPLLVDTGYGFWDVALLIIATGLSSFVEYYFGAAYAAFLAADQMTYIGSLASVMAVVLNTVLTAILIRLGFSIQVVKFVAAVTYCIKPAIQNIYVHKHYNLDRKFPPDPNALSMRKDATATSIANIVHDKVDILVLTAFCDIKIVSVYTVYNLIMSALGNLQRVFITGTESIFGNMWAKGEEDKIRHGLAVYEYFSGTFASVVISVTLVMILPFITLYTKDVTDVQYIQPAFAFLIIAAQCMFFFRTPYLVLVQGMGRYKETKNGAIAEAVINLVLSLVLVIFLGLPGVAIGTLAANIFRTVQYAVYIDRNAVHRGINVFIWKIIWAIGNIAVICLISSVTIGKLKCGSWTAWFEIAVLETLLACAVTVISSLIFRKDDFRETLKIVRRMLSRKK